MLFWVISTYITFPCPFQKRPSSFLQFGQVEDIMALNPVSPQAEQKGNDEHFADHLQMYVSKTFTKDRKSVLCAEYPSTGLKILLIQMENIFFTTY